MRPSMSSNCLTVRRGARAAVSTWLGVRVRVGVRVRAS